MLKVTITALSGPVTIQDPKPVSQTSSSQAVITVEAGTPASWTMQWQQLERIRDQLADLAALGLCTFAIESADVPSFAEEAMYDEGPRIDSIDNGGAGLAIAGGDTPLVAGNELLAEQELANAIVLADTIAGSVLLRATNPGYDGNTIDFEVVDSLGGGLAVTTAVAAGRRNIEIDLGGSAVETVTTVAAAVNALAGLAGIVEAIEVGVGATVVSTLQDTTAFTGGVGQGLTVLFCGVACPVTNIDITGDPIIVLTLDTPAAPAGLAAVDIGTITVRAGNKITSAAVVLA